MIETFRAARVLSLSLPATFAEVSAQLISLNSDKKLDDKINFTEDRGWVLVTDFGGVFFGFMVDTS